MDEIGQHKGGKWGHCGAGCPGYTDTCNYTSGDYVKCGDQCISSGAKCQCGSSDTFLPYTIHHTDQHCCIPSGESCTREPVEYWDGVTRDEGVCSEGRKLSMSSPCNNTNRAQQCYNSYQDSQNIGIQSHYTCPHTCVPWVNMCRGVSWCEGDQEVCGPDLRCPQYYEDWHYVTKQNLTSSLVPGHHYCLVDDQIDNGIFDSIDRSD